MEPLPYIERVKIQCEILLPLFRRLRDEIGPDKAYAMLREATDEFATELGKQAATTSSGTPLQKLEKLLPMFTANDAVEFEPLAHSDSELSFNVKRCQYAEYFKSLDEPEFGAVITCGIDHPMTGGISRDMELQRSQTILKGGDHCDFRWKSKS